MGIKLIILLALIVGVLYCIHLLVQDYVAVTAPRLLRLLFKRDLGSVQMKKPHVRWKKILAHDPLHCARLIFCHLGARRDLTEVQRGFVYMLTLTPTEDDRSSMEVFEKAYSEGNISQDMGLCRSNYQQCPFKESTLFEIIGFLLANPLVIQ